MQQHCYRSLLSVAAHSTSCLGTLRIMVDVRHCLLLFATLLLAKEASSTHGEGSETLTSCGGKMQSPIDIHRSATVWRVDFPFVFQNYDKVRLSSVLHSDGTVVFTLPSYLWVDDKPSVESGGLGNRFILQEIHLYWGADSSHGSEHTVNLKPFAGEIHLVHYNSKYDSYEDALQHADGLAVLGVFLQPSDTHNAILHPMLTHLSQVKLSADQVAIPEPINLQRLFPDSIWRYFRYQGSLDKAPCSEVVTWILFQKPVLLTEGQLDQLRRLENDQGNPVVSHKRPVQPVNQRIVYATL